MRRRRTLIFQLPLLYRGVSAASRAGEIGQGLVDGFIDEAHRRVTNGSFYGASRVSMRVWSVITMYRCFCWRWDLRVAAGREAHTRPATNSCQRGAIIR